ncbi:MAG: sulfatase-like hydrolase/transferase, partial [Planctomycetota bacterium]|nr:sulfatase-like hydrolase/transferase [Planctomycetota bacterium]
MPSIETLPPLTRRAWLRLAGLGAAAALARPLGALAAETSAPASRPNIHYLFPDQQYAEMMSCAGNPNLKTPAMDSLAATGTRFTRAYAANPVCVPARVGMMTGAMPSRIGMEQNEDMPQAKANVSEAILANSLGRVFRDAGYETAYGGKVHLPMTLAAIGFDAIAKDERAGLADACAAFLRAKHEKPFLLVASFINPHDICYMAIRAHARSLKPGEKADPNAAAGGPKLPAGPAGELPPPDQCPPVPENFEVPAGEPEGVREVDPRPFRFYVREHWTKDDWRQHRWAYCRLTEKVDGEIAVVLAALREAGLEEKTVVVFSSDHGDMDGSHRLEHKSVLYEEAERVPLIVSWRGVTRPGLVDREHLVSVGLDLIPTLCDFAGIAAPKPLAGRSIRPLAEGRAAAAWRESLVVEGHHCRALHTARFKYTVFDLGERREMLVDLEKDPGEMKNLASDPAYRETLLDCRKRLQQWYSE